MLLNLGENHVELLAPLGPDTPVGKFLAKRGPGLHHVAYQVSDIDAALRELAEEGFELIDKAPRVGIGGARVAFLEPKSTGRVLVEIVEPAHGVAHAVELHRRGGGALMPASPRRVSVGFQGGQVLALRVSDEQLKALHKALGSSGWHELETEDGPARLDLAQVVYVRVEGDDSRVGFGA